jgi:hypothetical protein
MNYENDESWRKYLLDDEGGRITVGENAVAPVSSTYRFVEGAKDSPYVITSTMEKDGTFPA